ncbi:MAG: DNA mismatch repair protein MutS [Nitrospirae bacterium]|nr:MAG: DNA mismatch repair protein MutS [Nitrospirota bacterium]
MAEQTPLMKQYLSIKEEYPDSILFFRLGDFYEMFGEDAITASKILQITLTTRDKGKENPIPMCGVPHFAADAYITKLINAGYKVAVCEQVEDPRNAKGIVKREVTRLITPGTHEPENPKENIFIMSISPTGKRQGIAVADLSTGEFFLFETERPLEDEIVRFEPREILCPAQLRTDIHYNQVLNGHFVTFYDDWLFDYNDAYRRLLEYYRVVSLDAFGCEGLQAAVAAGGALLHYLNETLKGEVVLDHPTVLRDREHMLLDAVTKRNLELISNIKDGTTRGTLLEVLDRTLTPMGGRFLRQAILKPLTLELKINDRLDAVEELTQNYEMFEGLRTYLQRVQDIERLGTKVLRGRVNARDLIGIKTSISHIPEIRARLKDAKSKLLTEINSKIGDFSELYKLINSAIVDDPPQGLHEGGIIKKGYRQIIDELRSISTSGKDYIASLEAEERKKTGIQSLKIGYNKVFGYYIEVTKANLHLVPEHYIRKQTLVNAERFITDELKELEDKILSAQERLKELEYDVFMEVLERIQGYAEELLTTSRAIGYLDFLLSLTTVARRNSYTRPVVNDSLRIEITEGRHPVLEQMETREKFIPNNTLLDDEDHRLLIITGPNMAGKSTYMRQVALIVLLAQIGSYVPAEKAEIGIVDRIFTRIGASDYLAEGQSTFMVEMIETANILNNATNRSLIILDEVGRGTSTFDGISIAWAVAEYIIKHLSARTLFATHYNELTELSMTLNGVRNYNVSVKEWGDEIIFLRKIEQGPADRSYGIQVARLAGLPDEVISRAKEVLSNLEKSEFTAEGAPRATGRRAKKKAVQLDLFSYNYEPILKELNEIDVSAITPEEAVEKLKKLKKLARES